MSQGIPIPDEVKAAAFRANHALYQGQPAAAEDVHELIKFLLAPDLSAVALPKVRDRPYYVMWIPVTADGNGPADLKDAVDITWEVWDHLYLSHGSYDCLPDALDVCDVLNGFTPA